jgi:flagellar biogenesis protein FliO
MSNIENSRSQLPGGLVRFLQALVREAAALFQKSPLSRIVIRKRERRLRLCETVSLGEKRIVAVVQCGHQQFLVGCAGSSIELLATLQPARPPALRIAPLEFKTR